jgi:hypothetical protein
MANAAPSRLGFINAASDGSFAQDTALFLKVFAGEVLVAFARKNIMLGLSQVRNISSGKSAQFPATWKATSEYHVPGTEITGAAIKHIEKIINVDALLISHSFIANIDEAMNHYEVRSKYAREHGNELARRMDVNLLKLVVLAARQASGFSSGDGFGGTQLTNAAYDTTSDTLVQGLFDAGQALDEKDIPEDGRHAVVKPRHYNLLVQSARALNRDWGNEGNGSYMDGKIMRVDSLTIHKSNNVPSTNIASAVEGEENTYFGDFTNTVAAVFHEEAVGTVKLLDLALESEYDIRRQGTLMVAKYACGHGILRPECAVELKKA